MGIALFFLILHSFRNRVLILLSIVSMYRSSSCCMSVGGQTSEEYN